MTSSNGNIFRVTGPLCGEFTPVNSLHKGQWRGTLMFSLICVWINDCVNNREAGDLRRYRSHYDVMVMNFHYAEPTNACALENKHSNEFQTSVMTKGHFNRSFCCYKISHKFILYSGLCILETTILKKNIIKSKKNTKKPAQLNKYSYYNKSIFV